MPRVPRQSMDITGQQFGWLTVIRHAGQSAKRYALWECACVCGRTVTVESRRLMGTRRSCNLDGHRFRDARLSPVPSLRKPHPDGYYSWRNMLLRCLDPKHHRYEHYGARGISVAPRWRQLDTFLSDMGPRPSRYHSIERLDVNGDYEPLNCVWATVREQSRNKTVTIFVDYLGERVKLRDLTERLGISHTLISSRLRLGWSLDEAVSTPNARHKKTLP